MTKTLICHADPTTTGGTVIATASTMFDGDRRIALDQELATCGNCPGQHPIQGTATDMDEDGQPCVLNGDLVQCPCGKNHVKASPQAGCAIG